MSILDVFTLVFDSDAKKLDEGLKHSESSAEKLIEKVKGADLASSKLGETFLDIAKKGAGILGLAVGFAALRSGIKSTADDYTKLDKLAEQFRSTAEAVDEFRDAGELLGLGSEVTIGGLTALDRAIQDTALDLGRAKKVFEEIGISVEDVNGKVKPTAVVMGELADKLKGFDRGKQLRIMERLGLDPALLKLFNADMAGLQARMAHIDRASGFNLEQAVKRSKEYTKANKELSLEVATVTMFAGKLGESLKVAIMPVFTAAIKEATKYVKIFGDFVMDNGGLVEGVMVAIAAAATYLLVPSLVRAGIAAAIAMAPYILMVAAVAAIVAVFALLYDEITNFMAGNDSLIGQFLEKYPKIAEVLSNIGEVIKWIAGVVSDLGQILWASLGLVFTAVGQVAAGIFNYWTDQLSVVGEVFSAIGTLVSGVFTYWLDLINQFLDKFGGIVGIAKSVGSAISGALNMAKQAVGIDVAATGTGMGLPNMSAVPGMEKGQGQLGDISASPMGTQTPGAMGARTTTKTTTVQIDKVEVSTQATDAAGISKSIGDTLGAQMRQAASNYDDGVAA